MRFKLNKQTQAIIKYNTGFTCEQLSKMPLHKYHDNPEVNERLEAIVSNYKAALKEAEFKQKCDEVFNNFK